MSHRPDTALTENSEASQGIISYHPEKGPGDTAEDMYKDVTNAVFEHVMPHTPPVASSSSNPDVARLRNDLQASQEQVAKLQSDLQASREQASKLKADVELATLKENELQSRLQQALASRSEEQMQLRQGQQDLDTAQHHRDLSMEMSSSDQQVLEHTNMELRAKLSELESELSVLYSQRQASTTLPPDGEPSGRFANTSSADDGSLLGAAYQQISVLNTQLAHLYTELTLARTEVATLRGERGEGGDGSGAAQPVPSEEAMAMESQKQAQQIADLVSDIRHLQLDLEYHQQKVDQLLEEKQLMMKDFKAAQSEIAEVKKELEEKDQLIKHQDVDLLHYRQQEQHQHPGGLHGPGSDDGILDALRTEAAAKDSALIVSHYELHKEKLMRDRLEQKNLKLMERMQKLMMVVETMRKDNQMLERALASKDRSYEEKDVQLRVMTQKFRQLHKNAKVGGRSKGRPAMLELESSMQNLPPLDSARRSESVNGRTSTTPRNAPQSPYHSAR
eukprot:TRINITY_DN42592_c0_g1_i1.p1 TRINITY_DN42592_c0_g1~~TRINITY_DN42592_c0_g1_i1.p1  ORF type:complete len:506 (+),score=122.04 TRINITY_DN42592_c0_g1_i1:94-1611(+)